MLKAVKRQYFHSLTCGILMTFAFIFLSPLIFPDPSSFSLSLSLYCLYHASRLLCHHLPPNINQRLHKPMPSKQHLSIDLNSSSKLITFRTTEICDPTINGTTSGIPFATISSMPRHRRVSPSATILPNLCTHNLRTNWAA